MHVSNAVSVEHGRQDAVVPDDLRLAAGLCRESLASLLDADWDQPAHGLDWPCRRTLQHIANALDWYALLLVEPTPEPFLSLGLRYVEQSIPDLLAAVERRAALLAVLAARTDPSARGYHYWGQPDAEGYLAMGCAEILLHTDDIVRGLGQGFGQAFQGPDDLSRRVVRRLFPWAPPDEAVVGVDGCSLLCWATGRIGLPRHGRVAADWVWHASPLSEWDGEVKTRASFAAPTREAVVRASAAPPPAR